MIKINPPFGFDDGNINTGLNLVVGNGLRVMKVPSMQEDSSKEAGWSSFR